MGDLDKTYVSTAGIQESRCARWDHGEQMSQKDFDRMRRVLETAPDYKVLGHVGGSVIACSVESLRAALTAGDPPPFIWPSGLEASESSSSPEVPPP